MRIEGSSRLLQPLELRGWLVGAAANLLGEGSLFQGHGDEYEETVSQVCNPETRCMKAAKVLTGQQTY